MINDTISVKGARQHNLKNVSLDIPKNKLVVLTGVSGSGKSSFAFDTLYAEGQRRYVESLSTYARQFLGIMEKPDVDSITGLSPSISIDQKTASHNPRSTVGTITEIYDFLRLLFARIGHPHCPNCKVEVSKLSSQEITDLISMDESEIDKYLCSKLILVKNNYYNKGFKYLIGQHNQENASLALKVGELVGITKAKIEPVIRDFPGLAFRLEFLGTLQQSPFYNDSTSTTPVAGIKAMEAISTEFPNKKIILVIGGKDKNLPFDQWLTLVNQVPDQIFMLPGSFSDLVEKKIRKKLTLVEDFKALFAKLLPLLNSQTIVLFSPSATSFATFNNEFDRGEQFSSHFKRCQKEYGA